MRFSTLQKCLLNDYQRDFPLTPCPYEDIADDLGVDEEAVLTTLKNMVDRRMVSRVGPVFAPNRVGVSTLAAMAVPDERLDEVAAFINTYPEVNHNYEREHRFNLWFVLTSANTSRLDDILRQIEATTGLPLMSLPLLDEYHIDLGFPLQWDES
ncbi:MAG: Lrp/AsnC family transcriptional regulator [Methylotetracoccus sp.]|nr:Lrp/AsnC family transcriptional regulator [Methylotetracoccus sp.]